MLGPLTIVDLVLIAVALLSGLLAMYRGFTREILSIISWVVAAGIVVYFVQFHKKFAEEMAQQMSAPVVVAQIVIGALLFLVSLVIVHLITARISDTILDSRVGMVDRLLGFVFGAARGFIIILICFMFYGHFWPEPNQHPFVTKAATRGLLTSAGNAIRPAMESLIEKIQTKQREKGEKEQQG